MCVLLDLTINAREEISVGAVADELAAEGLPVVLVRGANLAVMETGSTRLIRSRKEDLFI